MMRFEDVKDSRVKTLNMFEAVTKVHPFCPLDFIALKIGFSTKDKELKKAFKAKLRVFKAENTDYEQLVRPAFNEVMEEKRIEEEMKWRISR